MRHKNECKQLLGCDGKLELQGVTYPCSCYCHKTKCKNCGHQLSWHKAWNVAEIDNPVCHHPNVCKCHKYEKWVDRKGKPLF